MRRSPRSRASSRLAERLTFEGVEAGSAAGFSEAGRVSILGALLYQILLSQGRVGELTDLLAERVEASPEAPVWRVALAGALAESDRVDEARPHFSALAENECANVLPDIEYPVIMCGLGRLSFRIQPDPSVLRPVYEKLLPFAGHFNWSGSTITDANDQGLALAAATLGEHDAADAHFAAAIDLCERAGARRISRGARSTGRACSMHAATRSAPARSPSRHSRWAPSSAWTARPASSRAPRRCSPNPLDASRTLI